MNIKVYLQNGTNIKIPFNNELFLLSIQINKGKVWSEAKIVFHKNHYRDFYSVYGIECKLQYQYNDFEIGTIPMYLINGYKEFSLYEIIFNEELKIKIKTIVEKAIGLIKKENENLAFDTLQKYIRKKIKERNDKILNLLNGFLKEIERSN